MKTRASVLASAAAFALVVGVGAPAQAGYTSGLWSCASSRTVATTSKGAGFVFHTHFKGNESRSRTWSQQPGGATQTYYSGWSGSGTWEIYADTLESGYQWCTAPAT